MSSSNRAALVLTGGGFPAAWFEIGALAAFDEILGSVRPSTSFDLFVGASAGSIVATFLSLGISPEELRRGALEEGSGSFRIAPQDVFRTKPLLSLLSQTLKRFLKLLWSLRRRGVRLDGASILLALEENLPAGFLNLDPLRSTLASVIQRQGRADRFEDLPAPLLIPAFHLDSGKRVVFGGPDGRRIPVSLAVAASCAIPGIFEPVSIDGEDFVDGAIGEVSHTDLALAAGARTILVINPFVPVENDRSQVCFPGPDGICSTLGEKGLSYVLEQAQRISRSVKLSRETGCLPADTSDRRVFVIQPDPREAVEFLHGPLSDRQKHRHLDFGYQTARRFLASHGSELADHLARAPAAA